VECKQLTRCLAWPFSRYVERSVFGGRVLPCGFAWGEVWSAQLLGIGRQQKRAAAGSTWPRRLGAAVGKSRFEQVKSHLEYAAEQKLSIVQG